MTGGRWPVPDTWEWVRSEAIADIVGGGTPRVDDEGNFSADGIPWITPADLTGYKSVYIGRGRRDLSDKGIRGSGATLLPPGTVLFSSRAPVGYCAIAANEISTNQGFKSLVLKGGISPEFARYYLLSAKEYAESLASGTTFLELSAKRMSELEIPIPPLQEQPRIVRKLDTLSARTSNARTDLEVIPALVERYKLNFLRSVFRGEQTASFRDENDLEPVSVLLKKTKAPEQGRGGRKATDEVIPGKGGISVNDPGTELPEGWAWVPLLRVARQETGHTPSRSHPEWWGGDVCWISIPDANKHHGQVIHDTIQKTNEAGLANSSARLLPEGTVVLSRTASVGYVTILGREMATSQDFATWTCSAALEPKYLMYALMSEGEDIRDFGEGSTHTTIYFPEIRAFHIKLAPLLEQREIVRRIERAFGMVERVAAEADKARKLVDRLDRRIFAKAFAGELVPQNPNDEPASALIERIRDAHANAPKKTRQKRTEVYAMKETPRDRLIADSSSWPENGLPFEDIAKRVLMPHDDLRDALFELLGGTTPVLEQVFDKTDERMRLKRATS